MTFRFRPFCNIDPPHICRIWKSQPQQRGLYRRPTPSLLEQCVFSKTYFDPAGFIVAERENRPVGFIHAALELKNGHEKSPVGILPLLMTEQDESSVAEELIAQGEAYLRTTGAIEIWGGSRGGESPFYLGLYGGAAACGILQTDAAAQNAFRKAGYSAQNQRLALQKKVAGFRAPFDRRHHLHRRALTVVETVDSAPACRQQATLQSHFETIRYSLQNRSGEELAAAETWQVQPLAQDWSQRVLGLLNLQVAPQQRRQGYGGFLLSELLRSLDKSGFSVLECTIAAKDEASAGMLKKFDFQQVDAGTEFLKTSSIPS